QVDERTFLYGTRHSSILLSSVTAADDHARRALVTTRRLALGVPTPRAHRLRIALAGLASTTPVPVIDRVHDDAAHRRADAAPTDGAGLAVFTQVVFAVGNLANGRAAIDVHLAHLGGAQSDRRVHAFASGELGRAAGAASDLRALAG